MAGTGPVNKQTNKQSVKAGRRQKLCVKVQKFDSLWKPYPPPYGAFTFCRAVWTLFLYSIHLFTFVRGLTRGLGACPECGPAARPLGGHNRGHVTMGHDSFIQ